MSAKDVYSVEQLQSLVKEQDTSETTALRMAEWFTKAAPWKALLSCSALPMLLRVLITSSSCGRKAVTSE